MMSCTKVGLEFGATEFLAIWGAVLSTVAVAWNLFLGLKDRGELEVSGMVGKFTTDPQGPFRFILNITNVGRRPVHPDKILLASKTNRKPFWYLVQGEERLYIRLWSSLKLCFRPQERRFRAVDSILIWNGVPPALGEGESHKDVFEDYQFINKELMTIIVTDSCGRKFEMPQNRIEVLLQQAKDAKAETDADQQGREP